MSGHVFRFEPPAPLVSMNRTKGQHWSRYEKMCKPWWEAGYFYACEALPGGPAARRLDGLWRVSTLFPQGRAAHDPANLIATVKPLVDGMVKANLWPDDTAEFVTVAEPRQSKATQDVIVRLEQVVRASAVEEEWADLLPAPR